jgi:ABC-2 type transport system ATP-binding protein
VLALQELRKSFGSTVAVDGLTLQVRPGEVFGLLGPNGAGKSTTIGMAIGLIAPDSGTVTIEGHGAPTSSVVRAQIGVAPQQLALYDDLSGRENLAFFGAMFGLSGGRLRERVAHVLEAVGLTPRKNDRVGAYSGGMKRRLNLAVALIHDPPLLLLDEPTAGVDPQSRNSILDLVRALARDGRTVVYTTHYMEEASRLCDRIGIMDHGKLLAIGTLRELVAAHGGASAVVVRRGEVEERIESADPVREIARVLGESGDGTTQAPVAEVRVERPDLEAVFLKLTGRRLRD